MTKEVTKHIIITGRVQGVGFRNFTRNKARLYGLKGWVRNADEGTVEVLVSGSEESMNSFIDLLSEGPPAAYVKNIEQSEAPPMPGQENFSVRY